MSTKSVELMSTQDAMKQIRLNVYVHKKERSKGELGSRSLNPVRTAPRYVPISTWLMVVACSEKNDGRLTKGPGPFRIEQKQIEKSNPW